MKDNIKGSFSNAYKKKSTETAQTKTLKFNDESGAIQIHLHFSNIYKI